VLSIVDVKRGQHYNVGNPHPDNVHIDPRSPPTPSREATNDRCGKRDGSKNEQMVVFRPPRR
ncbi:MAG: hypothetical protein WA854_17320, partial [Candidatus Binataceae bacterium]